jgi:hypothetical protein
MNRKCYKSVKRLGMDLCPSNCGCTCSPGKQKTTARRAMVSVQQGGWIRYPCRALTNDLRVVSRKVGFRNVFPSGSLFGPASKASAPRHVQFVCNCKKLPEKDAHNAHKTPLPVLLMHKMLPPVRITCLDASLLINGFRVQVPGRSPNYGGGGTPQPPYILVEEPTDKVGSSLLLQFYCNSKTIHIILFANCG